MLDDTMTTQTDTTVETTTVTTEQPAEATAAPPAEEPGKVSELRKESLCCILDDDEVRQKGESLARLMAEISSLKLEASSASKRFKSAIEDREASLASLARHVRERKEWRDVEVRDEFDFKTGRVKTVRLDTLEVIKERILKDSERQELLPLAEGEEGPETDAGDENEVDDFDSDDGDGD